MGNRLYVGNIPYSMSVEALKEIFVAHGTVSDVQIITDRETGQSKGFGFVTFATEAQAHAGIGALNGHRVEGRSLNVTEARPKEPRTFSYNNDNDRSNRRPEREERRGRGRRDRD